MKDIKINDFFESIEKIKIIINEVSDDLKKDLPNQEISSDFVAGYIYGLSKLNKSIED